jgi:hypothetical protein
VAAMIQSDVGKAKGTTYSAMKRRAYILKKQIMSFPPTQLLSYRELKQVMNIQAEINISILQIIKIYNYILSNWFQKSIQNHK